MAERYEEITDMHALIRQDSVLVCQVKVTEKG